jgi:hypothetical protein
MAKKSEGRIEFGSQHERHPTQHENGLKNWSAFGTLHQHKKRFFRLNFKKSENFSIKKDFVFLRHKVFSLKICQQIRI